MRAYIPIIRHQLKALPTSLHDSSVYDGFSNMNELAYHHFVEILLLQSPNIDFYALYPLYRRIMLLFRLLGLVEQFHRLYLEGDHHVKEKVWRMLACL